MIDFQLPGWRNFPLISAQRSKLSLQHRLSILSVRRLILLVPLVLFGCATHPTVTASFDSPDPEAPPYLSRVDDPGSRALYHFGTARLQAAEGDVDGALASMERAAALDPETAYLQLSLAHLYLETGDDERALATVVRVLERHPHSAQAHLLAGNIHFSAGRDEEAVAFFQRAVALDPDEESAWLHLGIVYARLGEFSMASGTLRQLLEHRPDSLIAELTLARLYRETGLAALAEDYYLNLLEKEPGLEPVILELAGLYESTGELDKAIELYSELAQDGSDHHEVRHYLVRLLIMEERLDDALHHLREIVESHPHDLEAWRRIGLIHLERHEWEDASEVFSHILEIDPEIVQVRYYLGTALEMRHQWRRALEVFEEIPPDSHLYPDALAHRGYLYYQLDRGAEAIALIESHLHVMTLRPQLFAFLATLYEIDGAYDSARRVLGRGLERFPEDVELLYHKGIVFERMEERDDALLVMERILTLDAEHPEALNYIAYTWAERGENLEKALQMARKAVTLKGDAGHIIDTLGWVYFRLGRYEEARRQLEMAVAHLPEDPLVRQHLGEALFALGKNDLAREAFEKALELDPGNEEVLDLLRRVGQID